MTTATVAQPDLTTTWRVSAPHVRKALAFIKKRGSVNADDLVAWDRDHGRRLFDWDDPHAAEDWRRHQARLFLNRFRTQFEGMRVRALIHITEDAEAGIEDSAYYGIETITEHPGMRAQVIDDITLHTALCEGYTDVVDAEWCRSTSTDPHRELLQSVARRVADRHILHLVKMWLKVPVEERDAQGRRRMTGGKRSTRGTPQGGVISPLLANIYMHRFLRAWRQRDKGRQYRARLIAYADDFVIVSRGQAAAALAWTRDVMTRIGLTLNDAKTSIRNARTETFDFLGYTLGSAVSPVDGHWYLAARPSKKSLQRVKGAVRGVLASGNQQPWPQVVADLNRRLRGWANYFTYGSCAQAYDAVDHYVTAAVRQFLRRRHKVPTRGTRPFAAVYSEWGVLSLGMLRRSSPA